MGEKCPDILNLCETFLNSNCTDNQVAIDRYDCIQTEPIPRQIWWWYYIVFFSFIRKSLKYRRRPELEISKIETIWSEIELSNSKPVLVCSAYRPPSAHRNCIDLFEEELYSYIAQATGLEFIFTLPFPQALIGVCKQRKSRWAVSSGSTLFDIQAFSFTYKRLSNR